MIFPSRMHRRGRSSALGGALTRCRQAAVLAVVLMGLLLYRAPVVAAAAPVRVVDTDLTYTFSESITFSIQLESEEPIQEVILFYGMVGEPVVRRIYPEMTPGSSLALSHIEALEPGQFAPGTRLRAWWEVMLASEETVSLPQEQFTYVDEAIEWQELHSERVTLHWHGHAESQAKDLLALAEEVIDRLAEEMGVPRPGQVTIWVYNNERDMSRATSMRSESYDARVKTLGMTMEGGTLLLLGSHSDVQRTLAHELCHIVVGLATDNPYIEIPRWLDEGLAMYAEGELPRDNRRALEAAIVHDKLISLRSLTSYTGDPERVNLFYGQAYSVVAFILDEYGDEAMRELLAVFSEGRRQDDALERVLGFGLDGLERRWRVSLGLGPVPTVAPGSSSDSQADLAWECPALGAPVGVAVSSVALAWTR